MQWSGQAPCVIALPENHPLAKHEAIPLDELGEQTVITMSNSTRLRHRLATALLGHRGDAAPRRHIETTSNLTALMLVEAKVGVALMDPFTALCLKPRVDNLLGWRGWIVGLCGGRGCLCLCQRFACGS